MLAILAMLSLLAASITIIHYTHSWLTLRETLKSISFLSQVRLNIALKHETKSFLKLKIKVRDKIVADGLNDETFDVTKKGIHVNAEEFNKLMQEKDTIILDMRNHYESEIGHFKIGRAHV